MNMKNAIKRVQPSTRAQAERSQARLNYAERSILHEVKRVLLFLIVLSTAMAMSAQKYKPNTKWPYLYADFTDGTIYFDSNQKTKAQLNIHLMGNKLHYISSDQKILQAETHGIIRVEIGNDAYIYSDDQLVKILAVDQNNLVVEVTKADFDALFSGTGAYGASLNSSASRDLSSLDLGGLDSPELGRLLQEREDGRTISLKQQYFFIVNDKQIEANNKEVEKLLKDEDKDAWKTFSKQNKIKWKNVDSLKDVLHFICQHL